MYINHISFIIFVGEASAAYQNPSYALFASPVLKYNSAHAKYRTINFGLSAQDERQNNTDERSSNLNSKQKELEMLELAMKEAEMRSKEIEDEIKQIDEELFDIHNQAVRANAKEIKLVSHQESSSLSSAASIPSVSKKKSFLPSIELPLIGAGVTSLAAAVGLRKMLMSREEKKKESLEDKSFSIHSVSSGNILPSELGKALKGIEDVEAEALSALKLATEALEKNNVKVVNLKSGDKLKRDPYSLMLNQDEKLHQQIVLASSKSTAIKNEDKTEWKTPKQSDNGDNILVFDTIPSFGKIINDFLFKKAKREFENDKEKRSLPSSLQPVKEDKTDDIAETQPFTKTLALKSSTPSPVENNASIESHKSEPLPLDTNTSIKKGVVIFDTRVPSHGRRGQETISSMTNKFFDVSIDEQKIENTLAKIETELTRQQDNVDITSSEEHIAKNIVLVEHSDEVDTTSSDEHIAKNIVLVEHSDDVPTNDEKATRSQEDTVITTNDINSELNSDVDSVTGSSQSTTSSNVNGEPIPSEIIDLTDDEELLYPSDIISRYNAEQSKLNITTKGTLFRNPNLSTSQSKSTKRVKLNVLQFFRLRRKSKVGTFSLFGKSDDDAHQEKTRRNLASLVLLANVFEQTIREYRE